MGFRTVVMLNNDRCDEWERDADLGRKISQAMGCANIFGDIAGRERANLGYGLVVECVHSDQDTLVRLSDYEGFHPIAADYRLWEYTRGDDRIGQPGSRDKNLHMLKLAADNLGYRLVRKSK